MGPTRVTPPQKLEGATPKSGGARAPVTPPKAGPAKPGILKTPPGSGGTKTEKEKSNKETEKKAVDVAKVKATPKSPPPQGLSPYSSESVSGAGSPLTSGSAKEGQERKRSRTRSPLARRPFGAKQRRKFAQGKFGRVQFADPVDDAREKSSEKKGEEGAKEEPKKGGGKHKGKGKGKNKGKNKGKSKGKGKPSKGKEKSQRNKREEKPGGAAPSGSGGRK